MKITRAAIDAMKPGQELAYIWDSALPGFGVRCTPAGVKSYVLRYRHGGRQRIKTLGRCGALELSEAQAQAKTRLGALYAGNDPFTQRQQIETVAELAKAFQEGRAQELKPKTLAAYESLWRAHIVPALGKRHITAITEEDMATLRKRLAKKPTTFNRALALLIKAVKWYGLDVPEGHPFKRVRRFSEHGRDRILNETEMAAFAAAFDEYRAQRRAGWRYVDLFALLLLTGLRRDEWRLGRWEWLDMERGLYVLPDNKTGGRLVYIPQIGLQILQRLHAAQRRPRKGFIFPSPRTARKALSWTWREWDAMRKDLKLDGFTIHDMRRTAGSWAHERANLSQRQVADFLGHKRLETSSRYIHSAEKRQGAEAAAQAIAGGWGKPAPDNSNI